jgi:hypothetical protein
MCSACSLHFDDETRGRRSLEQAIYQHGATSVAKQSTLPEESKREERKGQSRRELSERLYVGRPEMFGGLLVPNILDRWAATAGRTKAPQRKRGAVPERCSSMLVRFVSLRSTCFW